MFLQEIQDSFDLSWQELPEHNIKYRTCSFKLFGNSQQQTRLDRQNEKNKPCQKREFIIINVDANNNCLEIGYHQNRNVQIIQDFGKQSQAHQNQFQQTQTANKDAKINQQNRPKDQQQKNLISNQSNQDNHKCKNEIQAIKLIDPKASIQNNEISNNISKQQIANQQPKNDGFQNLLPRYVQQIQKIFNQQKIIQQSQIHQQNIEQSQKGEENKQFLIQNQQNFQPPQKPQNKQKCSFPKSMIILQQPQPQGVKNCILAPKKSIQPFQSTTSSLLAKVSVRIEESIQQTQRLAKSFVNNDKNNCKQKKKLTKIQQKSKSKQKEVQKPNLKQKGRSQAQKNKPKEIDRFKSYIDNLIARNDLKEVDKRTIIALKNQEKALNINKKNSQKNKQQFQYQMKINKRQLYSETKKTKLQPKTRLNI